MFHLVDKSKQLYSKIRAKGLAATIAIATAFVLVLSSGVGATLAATGLFQKNQIINTPTPTGSQLATPKPSETALYSTAPETGEGLVGFDGKIYTPISGKEGIGFRWSGSLLMVMQNGKCREASINVKIGPPNWGYLSQPVAGIQGLGGGASSQICSPGSELGRGVGSSDSPYWKCFGFNEVWVEVSGNTPDAGLYKIPMPSYIQATNCPAGSENNNPNEVWQNSLDQGYGTSPYNTAPPVVPAEPSSPPPAPEPSNSAVNTDPSSSATPSQ